VYLIYTICLVGSLVEPNFDVLRADFEGVSLVEVWWGVRSSSGSL
jgi:hypothetical protein